ncbi:MFS transporter [Leptolyngbya ohadii]|uniref:MFS transporter n=1 Tax=Leptolyngbya ohadii TaxID=1962290 RepID=UPI001CED1E86|nr:MFS transporter [Leptolyngbya ohadii]
MRQDGNATGKHQQKQGAISRKDNLSRTRKTAVSSTNEEMVMSMPNRSAYGVRSNWLSWLNLRPEESGRTFLMFAFYTLSSVGVLWLEVSVAALFLGEYGADSLPWIYMASAGIGTLFGFFYDWLQKVLPLRQAIVITSLLMGLPFLLFRLDLDPAWLGAYTVFLMRLWLEAIYVISELITSITANQLFTIREIKRTYPLISSGILAADVISGLSLPILRGLVGLENVIFLACLLLLFSSGILFYLTQAYAQFFPDAPRRRSSEKQNNEAARRLRGSLQQYVWLVIAVFVLIQVLFVLLDFQYLRQIEQNLDVQVESIADFLALFSAILGIFELVTQWFVSGRIVERMGVFVVSILPPLSIVLLSFLTFVGGFPLFIGVVLLKFVDELLRYTVVASVSPVLFQPLPEAIRNRAQSFVRGIAEPLAIGLTGAWLLINIWLLERLGHGTADLLQGKVFLFYTAAFALCWLGAVLLLRSKYVDVLVLSANRGQINLSDLDLQVFKRNLIEVLNRSIPDVEKKSCIELLTQIDPKSVSEVLTPLLPQFSPALQRESLEAMLKSPSPPSPSSLKAVRRLTLSPLPPDVMAVALRYLWLTEPEPDLHLLRDYFKPSIDPEVRGTAAALMLRRGNPRQKAEATDVLRKMLTHAQERERVMGCRALGDAVYLQSLRLHIEKLLKDQSLRVRCAMLEAIAATHLEEYYPVLLRGLHYKSTRDASMRALVRLENEALPLLVEVAENAYKPEIVRSYAWNAIGQIGSVEALDILVSRLMTAWGNTRRTILKSLLKLPQESGIEGVSDRLGRSGIEMLIDQELLFLAHLYASLLDLNADQVPGETATLLRRSLRDAEQDTFDRLFLLMRFLYDSSTIQAAAASIDFNTRDSLARGLEILDNTLDLPSKRALLQVLDRQSDPEKLRSLSDFLPHQPPYQPLYPSERLRHLVELRHFLSDWTLACCFHLARQQRWSLTPEQTLSCLRDPTGYVREAVIAYLRTVSPKTLQNLLPYLKDDRRSPPLRPQSPHLPGTPR